VASLRPVFLVVLVVLTGGCATPPEVRPVADPEGVWRVHVRRLAAISVWTAGGKIAIRTADDSMSASLRWQQRGDGYRIRLSGPLGQGLYEISGTAGEVELRSGRGERYRATDPEALLYARSGWRVPLIGLRYWVLGSPQPGVVVERLQLDPAGRLESLFQAGWRIRYLAYQQVGDLTLPRKLSLDNSRVHALVVLSRWRLGS